MPPTSDEINRASDVFAAMLEPHVLAAIEAHRYETLARVPFPFRGIVAKHWPCFADMAPKMVATAMRSAFAQLGGPRP